MIKSRKNEEITFRKKDMLLQRCHIRIHVSFTDRVFVFVQDLEGSKSDGKIQEKVTKKHDFFHF